MVKKKKCNKCYLTKPISEFFLRRKKKWVISESVYRTYVFPQSICKECTRIQLSSLKILTKATYEDGSTNWYGVLKNIKKKCRRKNINYDLDLEDFRQWVKKQKNECSYCKLNLRDSIKVNEYRARGLKMNRFEIDRKNSDYSIGYRLDNICLACRYCNTKKGDEFSYEEFLQFAKKYITPDFKKLIKKLDV